VWELELQLQSILNKDETEDEKEPPNLQQRTDES
jgi:hypothetical protein